jgi:hypothetical protein
MRSKILTVITKPLFIQGNLYYSDGTVVLCTDSVSPKSTLFSGTCIVNKEKEQVGYHTNDWIKARFIPFEGKIELDQ